MGAALTILALGSCGGSAIHEQDTPVIAVLSAFPAELAALLEHATVEETVTLNGRAMRIGRLGGVRVVLGMTGIGLVNAAATTRAVLNRFDVDGVVVSGVAGSSHRIGDVVVADTWRLVKDGSSYVVSPEWLALAATLSSANGVDLTRCTYLPAEPSREVCMPHAPRILVGGVGDSNDPFPGGFQCRPGDDDIYGCDLPATGGRRTARSRVAGAFQDVTVADMETAAIAREAASHGLPFIAFRAVSDGAGDPLDLQLPFFQFAAYYRLAAHNAAAATQGFLRQLGSRSIGNR